MPDCESRDYTMYRAGYTKDKLEHSMRHYWPMRSDLTMIDGITMKGKGIIIPFVL